MRSPVFVRGYWSALFVREADVWRFRMLTFYESSPPGPRAGAK